MTQLNVIEALAWLGIKANISIRSLRSFDNFLFKFNVSLPLVTGELLQNTVDGHIINIYRVLKKLPGN